MKIRNSSFKMTFDFNNKLFLITGGAQGLGRGFAEAVLKVQTSLNYTYVLIMLICREDL